MAIAFGRNGSRAARLVRAGGWAVLAIVLAAVAFALVQQNRPLSGVRVLVIEMSAAAGNRAQMFWSADMTFAAERSLGVPLGPPTDAPRQVRFTIPRRGVRWLRFHPTDAPGEVRIHRLQFLDDRGSSTSVALHSLLPGDGIAIFTADADGVRIVTTPDAKNPSLLLPLGCIEGDVSWFSTVTPLALTLLGAAIVALIGAGTVVMVRTAFAAESRDASRPNSQASAKTAAVWFAVLLLVVLGGKLLLIGATPTTTPVWDQWDGEAALFVPFANCSLTWDTMFGLHNEHRIFFTRLLALDLLVVNKQWDPRLEQVANAVIHTLTAALVALMFWIVAGRKWLDLLVVLAAVAFALPFAWENTLIGFQSAFYFLLLFSMLSLWLATRYRAGSGAWFLGWACSVCALFSAASGLVAPVAIAALSVLDAANDRKRVRDSALNVVIGLVIFGLGYAISAPPLAHDQVVRVATVADFITALGRNLAWPWIARPSFAFISWLPVTVVLYTAVRRRLETTEGERLTLVLALWVVLHGLALAFGRGARAGAPSSRYMDFLSLGFFANAIALATLLDRARPSVARYRIATGLLVAWFLFTVVGLNGLVKQSLTDVAAWRQVSTTSYPQRLRRFVITNDASAIAQAPLREVPYPDPQRLLSLLQNPYIRTILPAAVREPLRMHPRAITDGAFVPDGTFQVAVRDPIAPSWGSYAGRANAAQGVFESEPIAPCTRTGYLRFDVAGHLGYDHHKLAVRDVRTGHETSVVRRRGPTQDGWSTATVQCPDGPFTIVAADNSRWSWFAFRPPVEIGSASVAAERLIEFGWPMLVAGLILFGLAARWT